MRDDFAIFILTYKRPDKQLTYHYLMNNGYTGKLFFVLSDDDPTISQYIDRFGKDSILIFNKQESLSLFDIGDNFNDMRAVVYARNKLYDLAKSVGIKYAMVLDDDYKHIKYRMNNAQQYPSNTPYIKNIDRLILITLDYFLACKQLSIAYGQGGDYIGGKYNYAIRLYRSKRKVMNSFYFDVNNPMEFQGTINEDLTGSVLAGIRGHLVMTLPFVSIEQLETQSNQGGLTDIYLNLGTYVKSFYSVMMAPSCVKIAAMGDNHKRIHHQVSWNNAASKIISDRYKKQ